jgi:hypothetical protein
MRAGMQAIAASAVVLFAGGGSAGKSASLSNCGYRKLRLLIDVMLSSFGVTPLTSHQFFARVADVVIAAR